MVVCVVWSSSTTINALEVQRYELTCDCMPNKKRKIINREIEACRISPTKIWSFWNGVERGPTHCASTAPMFFCSLTAEAHKKS